MQRQWIVIFVWRSEQQACQLTEFHRTRLIVTFHAELDRLFGSLIREAGNDITYIALRLPSGAHTTRAGSAYDCVHGLVCAYQRGQFYNRDCPCRFTSVGRRDAALSLGKDNTYWLCQPYLTRVHLSYTKGVLSSYVCCYLFLMSRYYERPTSILQV